MPRDHIATASLRFMPVDGAVSLNRREYPKSTVDKVIQRAQERLADGQSFPLTALTHHEAGDDNLRIVGKIQGEGSIYADDGWYTADVQIADTQAGHDIAYLAANGYLVSCSLRGSNPQVDWHDEAKDQMPTVLDFELDGIDFTNYPGIAGTPVGNASIGKVSWEALNRASMSETNAEPRVIDTFPIGAGIKDVDEDLAQEIVERQEGGDRLNRVAEVLKAAVEALKEGPRKPGTRFKTGADSAAVGSPGRDTPHVDADNTEVPPEDDNPDATQEDPPTPSDPSVGGGSPARPRTSKTMPAPVQNPALAPYQRVVDAPGVGVNTTQSANGESHEAKFASPGHYTKKDRQKIPADSFAGPGKTFPIVTQQDVYDAAGLVGKAANPAAVKAKIKAIAERKGFKLPQSWQDDKQSREQAMDTAAAAAEEPKTMAGKAMAGKKKAKAKLPSKDNDEESTEQDVERQSVEVTGLWIELGGAVADRMQEFAAGAEETWGTPADEVVAILRGYHFALEAMFPEDAMTLDIEDFGIPPQADMMTAAPGQVAMPQPGVNPKADKDGTLAMSVAHDGVGETRIDGELSLEDQRDYICAEICESLGRGFYAYIVATGSKAVVYCRIGGGDGDYDFDDTSYWRQEYSFNGETVELQGEPQPYMLTFAPAPASAGDGEENTMDPKVTEKFDRLAGAIEALVAKMAAPVEATPVEAAPKTATKTEPVETSATDTTTQATADSSADGAFGERIAALEARLAEATDPGKVLAAMVALKQGRKGMVTTTESGTTAPDPIKAVLENKDLDAEQKLHQFLVLTSPNPR